MNGKVPITYVPRPDASTEGELNALAAVYRYIFFDGSNEEKAAGVPNTTDDKAMKGLLIGEKEGGGKHVER